MSAANSAKPKPFVPVNIPQTAQMALVADQAGYNTSDEDWKRRFPKLVLGRDANIADADNNLSGLTSPYVSDAMKTAGLSANLGDTEFQKAQNLGQPILSMEQRDRNYFQKQLGMNPQRTAGLSGQDATNLAIANTGNAQNYTQGIFQSNIARYNAGIQQNIQNSNAAVTGLGSFAGLLTQNSNRQSGYLNPGYYNTATGGGNGFRYLGDINASGGYT